MAHAQRFDLDMQRSGNKLREHKFTIAILGFGRFGQFLAKKFVELGHTLFAYSRTDHSIAAGELGVRFFRDAHELCECRPDVVLLATSILSSEDFVVSFPFQRLCRNTLVVDVLSVKEFARSLLLRHLPLDLDILCTHPMFGPESGKTSWAGLPFAYEKVRINSDSFSCDRFIGIFEKEGCRMLEMSCAEHDRYAASSQFITHTIGRVLEKYGLVSSPINTKGYETLLKLVETSSGDSADLYNGLFLYNKNAMDELRRLESAFEEIKNELFEKLYSSYRKLQQCGDEEEKVVQQKVNGNGSIKISNS